MLRIRRAYVPLIAILMAGPGSLAGQGAPKTVLFVCEHGTVKSLMAKVLFDQYAREVGLGMRAESRGTHADSVVPPWMQRNLATDHIELGDWRPRGLAPSDLQTASYVVSFDVPKEATMGARVPREQWDGLPSITADYAKGRDAIKARVKQLVDSLKRVQGSSRPN